MRERILLIVDDDAQVGGIIQRGLQRLQVRVLTAATGSEALRMARSRKPDIILLDILLPDMDGYEICVALRREQALQATPILIMSGMGNVGPELAGLDCGADDYIAKPFTVQEMAGRIQKLLQRREGSD